MKNYIRFLVILIFIMVCLYLYARFIEPSMLNVYYENIYNDLIKDNSKGIKILQFSDTHLSEFFQLDDLKKSVIKINSENPDIVVFTGDLFDHYDDYIYKENLQPICDALNEIKAPMGKYAVYGNHDYGGGAEKVYKQVMEKSGFILLVNDNIKMENYNINIIGLDDSIFGRQDKERVIKLIDESYYNIILSHEPDVVDYYLEYNVDLFLSGHSHGGQINIPVISSRILPPLAQKYINGIYNFENRRNTVLYVNIGIGSTKIPLRFMAAPELTVFTLRTKQ